MKVSGQEMRELCIELVKAESEDEVVKILTDQNLWDDASAWRYYGNNESNFSEIGNQQESADTAVVEKYINSVDAMLLAKCFEDGKKPDSAESPQSITEGLESYFGIINGKLSSISASERSSLAENIGMVASGKKKQPCYSFFDFGIGQSPSQFPDTFLSLAASNKIRIQFVQGRFNMGSTGVLQFCGARNIQLIISRKHPAGRKGLKDGGRWGFTIVRRENPKGQMKSSVYTYLAPKGQILSFNGKDLPILPSDYPQPYGKPMAHGTYVKVYDYNIGTGLRTNILFDLYNRLSILTPNLALPVRLYERRKGYTGNSFETTLGGLSVRLDEDKQENLEEGFPASHTMKINGHPMSASIYAFKKGAIKKYTKGEGVIFILNGQTHGALDNNFFCRTATGMSYLADSLLVVVDCSSIDLRTREDLFMNSRDRLRAHPLKSAIERDLESVLRNHPGLKALRERRQAQALKDKLGDSKPLKDLLESIVKKSPTLSRLFRDGIRITDPFKSDDHEEEEKFEGQQFPSFFAPVRTYPVQNPKNCHQNFRFRIPCETDAVNDYFDRDVNPGEFKLMVNGQTTDDYSLTLWNGHAILSVKLPKNPKIGDQLHYEFEVSDISRAEPIRHDLWVNVIEPGVTGETGKKKKKKPASKKKGGNGKGANHLDVPNALPVYKDEWEEYDFDEFDALAIMHTGKGMVYDFYYNADNAYLKLEQKFAPDEADIIDTQFKSSLVLLGLSYLNGSLGKNGNNGSENVERQVKDMTKAISPVLIPMIRSLGDLSPEE